MLESALYARIRPKLNTWGTLDRIENATGSGMADIHYCIDGQMGWIETKMEHGGALHFERFQLNWLNRQVKAGATNVFVMYGRHSRDGHMEVAHASAVLAAPRHVDRKWHVVMAEDVVPALVMTKQYDWDALRLLLSSPYTKHLETV
jgi:hypothetical protein